MFSLGPFRNLICFSSQAMPELLRSAKLAIEKGQAAGRDESYLKQLADFIIPALVEALHKVFMVLYFFFSLNVGLGCYLFFFWVKLTVFFSQCLKLLCYVGT